MLNFRKILASFILSTFITSSALAAVPVNIYDETRKITGTTSNPLKVSQSVALETDYFIELSRGNITGQSAVQKFGRNADIDSAAAEEIWAGGGLRTYLSSAETLDVVSDNANDDGSPVGTGARTVMIQGLDSSYNLIEETVTLNGTSAVTTANSYLRVHRAYVLTAGTGGTNIGQIVFDPTSSGSGARQADIEPGDGQTLLSHYTIPAGKTAYMVGGQAGVATGSGAASGREARITFFRRDFGGAWRVQQEIDLATDGTTTTPDFVFTSPLSFPEKTDLKFLVAVSANNTEVYIQYNLILIDD